MHINAYTFGARYTTMKNIIEEIISSGNKELGYLINNPVSYSSDAYIKAKQMLGSAGYQFPENFYQTHRFLASISERCGVPYYLIAMNDATEGGITGPLICLDKIQESINEKSIACKNGEVLKNTFNDLCNSTSNKIITGDRFSISDYELCSIIQEMLDSEFDVQNTDSEIIRIMTNDSKTIHFERSILISEGLMYNIHDAYLFNLETNTYAGIYHDEYADCSSFYRSIVDYLLKGFSGFSEELYDSYSSYIKFNDLSFDDGLPYKGVDEEYVIVGKGVSNLVASDYISLGTYSTDCYGNDWDPEKNGYPMMKGW